VYLLVFHAYTNEMRGYKRKIPSVTGSDFLTLDWGRLVNVSAATTGFEPEPTNVDKYR
jgi:hypothetical protein